MKNISWKKIALITIVVGVFVFVLFTVLPTQGTREPSKFVDPAFGEYISSYSSGVLSSGSGIRIVFARDAVDDEAVGKESSEDLFSFNPSVKGTALWLDKRTIEFKPTNRLQSGQLYEVRFALSRVMDVPGNLKSFEYTFQVLEQNFEFTIENVKPYVKTELTRQKIEGILLTSDFASPEMVEKMFTARQENKPLSITWSHSNEGKNHAFIIENVVRKDEPGKVEITADGKSLGISRSESLEVEIPSLRDFKVTHVRVDQGTSQHVVVQFSDPINEKQNLNGLITLSEVSNLEFEVHDNEVLIYPPVRQTGTKSLTLEAGIQNILNYQMKEGATFDIVFEELKPATRFVGKGNILPGSEGLILPFEAVNLKSVDVQIVKVYEKNVIQFLQVNDYDGNSELRRVGKPVYKKRISLENSGVTDLSKWNRFTLDLASFIDAEPGAIYQVRLSFKQSYTTLACNDGAGQLSDEFPEPDEDWSSPEAEFSYWDSYEDYYYGEDYDWRERENPCHSSYYTSERAIRKNIIASNLGLIAKQGGDGNTVIFVNDLKTTEPLGGVNLELYDFQQQLLGTASTGKDGYASIQSGSTPFVLIAKNGAQRGYLQLNDGESLSLSSFDVSGEKVNKGIKGFIYGERGVWRPGDSLYLSFILEDKLKTLPPSHPVVFELQNPQGQITSRLVRSVSENGFYSFATVTDADAPTGNWKARVKIGGTEFSQTVKIETVKPNRLKINLDFGVDKLKAGQDNIAGNLTVSWLHGAPGKNLKAEFEVLLTKAETRFRAYPDYTFEDPSREFYSEAQVVYSGYTDGEGKAIVNTTLEPPADAPGMLNAVFRGKVFEESGNFSIDRFTLPYYPYHSFTGIRLPVGDKARGMLLTDTTHKVDVVTIDAEGQPVSRDRIEMSMYKLQWRSWWDNSEENAVYMTGSYAKLISSGVIATRNGKGQWSFKIKYPDWGRYLVKAYDPVSGHSSAKIVYIDWPGWAGRARGDSEGATMLTFSSDKPSYTIGEKATVVIPGSAQGRALITLENGSRVLEHHWLDTKAGDNPFTFSVSREMTPNVFVHVSLLQPHAQTVNDSPIRMYGVIPIRTEDETTHLQPIISMPDVLEPGQEIVIRVSEKLKRKMTYTLAMVDEGLLDLTRFKTPDPWNRFYAREALGVKTWDLYDHVMGAFGARMERLLAIGGDAELMAKEDDPRANRFKPVVKFLGPFTLSGNQNEHRITIPQYIGSVKTMVVAGYEGAYGSAEKITPVRQPLMVLATLPRVLAPEENLKLPVTLFTMEKNIRNVKVEIKTSGPLQVKNSFQQIAMSGSDQTVEFDLSVLNRLGVGKIEVTATSGNYKSKDIIEIDIRNPNPPITRVLESLLDAGKTWSTSITPVGLPGTNTATLEISSLPPINLDQRLKYLLQYPYGCLEQVVSAVFPQLYLDQVKTLSEEERILIQNNVRAGIERLKAFQHRDGGFTYWPGAEDVDSWATTYAGHFMVEAEAKGYIVPSEILKRWKKFQRNRAQSWRRNQEFTNSDLIQAYRLYSLALAGDPELGAMNRMREQRAESATAAWMLAAAYVKAGQPEAARQVVAGVSVTVKPYQELAYSYGSDIRDKAIILETLVLLGDRTKAFEVVKDLSNSLSNPSYWMSTQTVAWCLKSIASFASSEKRGALKFVYSYNGKEVKASTDLPVAQVNLPVDGVKSTALKVVSESGGTLFTRLIMTGTPSRGEETEESNNLSISVTYTDVDGRSIDPSRLEQGKEFIASVTLYNPGTRGTYKNLALNQIFPSGWEINNLRLDKAESRLQGSIPTYQDIRDDRVYTYFDLAPNQRKTFQVILTASYSGTYYLPAVSCEAMYDRTIYARKKGQVVEVVKGSGI